MPLALSLGQSRSIQHYKKGQAEALAKQAQLMENGHGAHLAASQPFNAH